MVAIVASQSSVDSLFKEYIGRTQPNTRQLSQSSVDSLFKEFFPDARWAIWISPSQSSVDSLFKEKNGEKEIIC